MSYAWKMPSLWKPRIQLSVICSINLSREGKKWTIPRQNSIMICIEVFTSGNVQSPNFTNPARNFELTIFDSIEIQTPFCTSSEWKLHVTLCTWSNWFQVHGIKKKLFSNAFYRNDQHKQKDTVPNEQYIVFVLLASHLKTKWAIPCGCTSCESFKTSSEPPGHTGCTPNAWA